MACNGHDSFISSAAFGRPWFRHLIYAPGWYTGYGVKTVPGVREAIEQGKWQEGDSDIVLAGRVLENEAALIERTTAALGQAVK